MRYEDRSRPALIKDLKEGVEASLELTVTHAHGYAVRNQRGYGRPQLYIFEVAGIDGPMTGREVIVWWFVSGRRAYDIVKYYTAKLARGTRFITFGRWEWEARRNTYKLRLNNAADELEILLPPEDTEHTRRNSIRNKAKRTFPILHSLQFTSGAEFRSIASLVSSTPSVFGKSCTPYSRY